MPDHNCTQVANFKRIDKLIFGNGRPGLLQDVTEIKTEVGDMKEDIKKLADSYELLAESRIESNAIKRAMANTIKIVGIVMGVAIPLTALIMKLI